VPTPSFRLSDRYCEQTVQFFIIELLDGIGQVFRKNMPSRIRRRSWICRRRGRVLDIRCRKGIGLALVGRLLSHVGMMPCGKGGSKCRHVV
jgi:hypothetical protein